MTGWRPRYLVREAVSNVLLPGRGVWFIAATLLAGTLVAGHGAGTWLDLQGDLETQISEGRSTVDMVLPDGGQIHRPSCDALASMKGVARAGAIVELGRRPYPQLGESIRTVAVSRSLLPELTTARAAVGSALWTGVGSLHLLVPQGEPLHAASGPTYESALGLSSAVAIPLEPPVSTVTSCTVQLERYADVKLMIPRLIAAVSVTGGDVAASARLTAPFDLIGQYLGRLDRYLFVVGGILGGLVAAGRYALRGSELAAYRFAGATRADLAVILSLEQALMAGFFVIGGLGVCAILPIGDARLVIGAWAVLGGLAWWSSANVGALRVVFANPMILAKDR